MSILQEKESPGLDRVRNAMNHWSAAAEYCAVCGSVWKEGNFYCCFCGSRLMWMINEGLVGQCAVEADVRETPEGLILVGLCTVPSPVCLTR